MTMRDQFAIPVDAQGRELAYFCGNSLGCMPRAVPELLQEECADWARFAVDGHFDARRPWYRYHERFRDPLARLVGAQPHEVVLMNSLTVNLHLMMMSFFQPERQAARQSGGGRTRILMEAPAFPSDTYALKTHINARGGDVDRDLVIVRPRDGEHCVRDADLQDAIREEGDRLALVLLAGVNFLTGQVIDMPGAARAAHDVGAFIGLDLAHAAGNIPLRLHDWDIDFACWCSYKYLNGGPGAIAGVFVHEKHARNRELPRFAGWWGNDPDSRFMMHLQPDFIARNDADGWQLSNPPILGMTPLIASLALFDEAGMDALRATSLTLTPWLREALESRGPDWFEIITPREAEQHGCQLSILVHDRPRERFEALTKAGVTVDFREPNVIRVAPAPLYNTREDCERFVDAISGVI